MTGLADNSQVESRPGSKQALADDTEPAKATEDEQCSVCWGLLCEPVAWPGCSHHFCLLCTLRLSQRQKPACALCRAEAPRVCKVTNLQVDAQRAALVRRSVGFSAYESQRRQLWALAAEAPEELRAMPIFCTTLRPKQFPSGTRLGLRFREPRCLEMVRRAMAPGGTRRFAAVTRSTVLGGLPSEGEIGIGAQGRLCEILESGEAADGSTHAIVETGAACRVLSLQTEEVDQSNQPLFIGELEEVEDEDLVDVAPDGAEADRETFGVDSGDAAAAIVEDGRIELLRERHLLLEVLHATMELEQARLEQRRLQLTMLLSQRRIFEEIVGLNAQVTELSNELDEATARLRERSQEGMEMRASSPLLRRSVSQTTGSSPSGGRSPAPRVPRATRQMSDQAGSRRLTARVDSDVSSSSLAASTLTSSPSGRLARLSSSQAVAARNSDALARTTSMGGSLRSRRSGSSTRLTLSASGAELSPSGAQAETRSLRFRSSDGAAASRSDPAARQARG
eukprot:TRINITY_DN90794_c0_g1_i1.p1 TRINITY_DN90794_c0_g1~~TRINITY_DN90794_c0_g1_i1.p1  ORF type:complete len:510 (-),score=115.59 TRINITY_DN90794_c0_g1_i1:94-1623(-)